MEAPFILEITFLRVDLWSERVGHDPTKDLQTVHIFKKSKVELKKNEMLTIGPPWPKILCPTYRIGKIHGLASKCV
jgi:hypothetical protein